MSRRSRFLCGTLPIHLVELFLGLLPNTGASVRLRGKLVSMFLGSSGTGFRLAKGTVLLRPDFLEVGDDSYFAHRVWVNATGKVRIGSNVMIGPMSVLASSDHVIRDGKLTRESEAAEIVIEDDVWLGSHVVITRGVTVGAGSVVAAGSVVTRNVPPGSVVCGVPARQLRKN